MQVAGEDRFDPPLPPSCAPLFPALHFIPSLFPSQDCPSVALPQRFAVTRRRGFSRMAFDSGSGHVTGRHRNPATESSFFRRDIGGKTQGIHRFQLLEGVE